MKNVHTREYTMNDKESRRILRKIIRNAPFFKRMWISRHILYLWFIEKFPFFFKKNHNK